MGWPRGGGEEEKRQRIATMPARRPRLARRRGRPISFVACAYEWMCRWINLFTLCPSPVPVSAQGGGGTKKQMGRKNEKARQQTKCIAMDTNVAPPKAQVVESTTHYYDTQEAYFWGEHASFLGGGWQAISCPFPQKRSSATLPLRRGKPKTTPHVTPRCVVSARHRKRTHLWGFVG